MKNILEDLWYSYEIQRPVTQSEDGKEALANLLCEQKKLNELLNDEQREQLEKYSDFANKFNGITEKQAFINGVRFAASFFISALSES